MLKMEDRGEESVVKIPVGKESFEEIRRDQNYYVDKTELIYEMISSTNNKASSPFWQDADDEHDGKLFQYPKREYQGYF